MLHEQKKSLIFIVYSNLDPGGIPAKIIDIINVMKEKNTETKIVLILQKGHKDDLRHLIQHSSVEIKDFPSSIYFSRRLLFSVWVWYLMFTKAPTAILVFISPYALPVIVGKILLFWRKMKIIVSEDHFTRTMLSRMAYPGVHKLGIRILYPFADVIIVPTEALRNQLMELTYLSKKKIQIIKNWTRFSTKKIDANERSIDIVHIGRLVPSKNPQKVLSLMHVYVTQINKKGKCCIVGDGSEFNNIAEFIAKYKLGKRITLQHSIPDVSKVLLRSKIFLFLPEKQTEGFPIILLDAMATGVPVITEYFHGVEEVIQNNVNGFILDSENSIVSIEKNLQPACIRRIQNNSKRTIIRNHSLKNVKEYLQYLN